MPTEATIELIGFGKTAYYEEAAAGPQLKR